MPSGTIGDTGTAGNNVTGVVADYSSPSSWEAAIDGNNQTGTIIRINASFSSVTINAAFTGITLTAHADAQVIAPSDAGYDARARIDGTGSASVTISTAGTIVEKIGVRADENAFFYDVNNVVIRRCLGIATNSSYYSFYGTGTGAVLSNLAGWGVSGSHGFRNEGSASVYHATIHSNGAFAFLNRSGGTTAVYGSIGFGSVGFDGTGFSGDYNVSNDTSAPGSSSTKYAHSVTISDWLTSVTGGSEDFSIPAARQGWWAANKDAIDQTGWPADVATDIVGTSRAAPIDPGVWQTPAAGSARGMPFGTRSTAFNGGRALTGLLR